MEPVEIAKGELDMLYRAELDELNYFLYAGRSEASTLTIVCVALTPAFA